MNIVAIIQARMRSSRLPAKVMMEIAGEPMLAHVINRVRRASMPSKVIVATSTRSEDDVIQDLCNSRGVPIFRGSELDVLDRYYQASREYAADVVIRITSDCPLIEPEVLDRVVNAFLAARPDYASNTIVRSYPRGLDVEVVGIASLMRAWSEAAKAHQRAHVTPYFYENPTLFQCLNVADEFEHSVHRWTVDTSEDLAFVRAIYARLGPTDIFGWRDVLALLTREPELLNLNRSVQQKLLPEG